MEAVTEAYNFNRVSELQDLRPTEDQNEFGENFEGKTPLAGFTHFFPRGFGVQKLASHRVCGGAGGWGSALVSWH